MSALSVEDHIDTWRSGSGKVIRVGDVVYVDRSAHRADIRGSYRYRVKEIRHHPGGTVEVTVFGGKPQHHKFHTFVASVLHVARKRAAS